MSGFRFEIETSAREALIGGGAQLLVRVRLLDGPGVTTERGYPSATPDAFTDLRPQDARLLAFELLAAAEHAERSEHER